MRNQVDFGHLRIAYFDLRWVAMVVQFAFHFQTLCIACSRDQVDDGRMSQQRPPPPVLSDEREQPMLDFVPLACAGREMANRDRQPCPVRQALQFEFPKPHSGTVAAAAVSCDQQAPGFRINLSSHLFPPAFNRGDRKCRRVVIDSNTHPAGIPRQIIHS